MEKINFSEIAPVYAKFQKSSNCYTLPSPEGLKKVLYLIHGNDEMSLKIAKKLKRLQTFYNTIPLDMDLCTLPPSTERKELCRRFVQLFNQAYKFGTGVLISHFEYDFALDMENCRPEKLFWVSADVGIDSLEMLVEHRQRTSCYTAWVKDDLLVRGLVSGIFHRSIIKAYDKIMLEVGNMDSVVRAAYAFQELRLIYGIEPEIMLINPQQDDEELQRCLDLCQGLLIPPQNILECRDGVADWEAEMKGQRILFIVPARRSVQTAAIIKKYRNQRLFNADMCVFPEDFTYLVSGKEFAVADVLADLVSAVKSGKFCLESEHWMAQIDNMRSNLPPQSETDIARRRRFKDKKFTELFVSHSSYLQKLYDL